MLAKKYGDLLADVQLRESIERGQVLELLSSLDEPRAQRLRRWLAETAHQRLQELENPELTITRTREAYGRQGYSRQWIDQRMRSVSARHELTSEWYRRGVADSEQFRALTNEMMQAGFGFDVENYRRYKRLYRTGQNLRDHMTDIELSLTSLGETTTVELHRARRSASFRALLLDAKDAGQVVRSARSAMERQLGRSIVSACNHLPPTPITPPQRPRSVAA